MSQGRVPPRFTTGRLMTFVVLIGASLGLARLDPAYLLVPALAIPAHLRTCGLIDRRRARGVRVGGGDVARLAASSLAGCLGILAAFALPPVLVLPWINRSGRFAASLALAGVMAGGFLAGFAARRWWPERAPGPMGPAPEEAGTRLPSGAAPP